jgi:hypothetical protein
MVFMPKKSMLGLTTTTNNASSLWRTLKTWFRAVSGDGDRFQAALSLIVGPYLIVCLATWPHRGSFAGPELSFFEELLLFVLFVMGGRLWDLHRKAEKSNENLAELQRALDVKLAEMQKTLGDRLIQIKGVSLDLSEQLSAIVRTVDPSGSNTAGIG